MDRIGRISEKVAASGLYAKLVEDSLDKNGFAVLVGYDFGGSAMTFDVVASRAAQLEKAGLETTRRIVRGFPTLMTNRLEVDVVAQPGRGLVLKCWLMFEWTDGHNLFAETPKDELKHNIENTARMGI